MRVMVTGATGFLGRHAVSRLLADGHSIVAIARDSGRALKMPWFEGVEFIPCDLHQHDFLPLFEPKSRPDALVHLAWPGLPHYREFFHLGRNLPADLAFLKAAVESGVPHLVIAGTCLEYGIQYGPLTEGMDTRPTTPYGLAKDTLRKGLQLLQQEKPFILQWLRIFYMHGEGQNPSSLLAQLDRAIEAGEPTFNMSAGDQLRDYLPVEEVAENFALVLKNPQCSGVVNCSSGNPISILDLVKRRCRERASNIRLNRGFHSFPDYESLAFWGIPSKLSELRRSLERSLS